METNVGGKIAAFGQNGITGVDVAGCLSNNYYRIYASNAWSGHIANAIIVISYSPILDVGGHDTPDWNP